MVGITIQEPGSVPVRSWRQSEFLKKIITRRRVLGRKTTWLIRIPQTWPIIKPQTWLTRIPQTWPIIKPQTWLTRIPQTWPITM